MVKVGGTISGVTCASVWDVAWRWRWRRRWPPGRRQRLHPPRQQPTLPAATASCPSHQRLQPWTLLWFRLKENSTNHAGYFTLPNISVIHWLRTVEERSRYGRTQGFQKFLRTVGRETPALWDGGRLLYVCYIAKFDRSRSNGTSVIRDIRRKTLTPRVPPFRFTQGHCNWRGSIGYLWLPVSDS